MVTFVFTQTPYYNVAGRIFNDEVHGIKRKDNRKDNRKDAKKREIKSESKLKIQASKGVILSIEKVEIGSSVAIFSIEKVKKKEMKKEMI